MTTTSYVLLLVKNNGSQNTDSIIHMLENEGHQLYIAESPNQTITQIKTVWPNLVILNLPTPSEMLTLQQQIQQVKLNIPCILLNENLSVSEQLPEETFVLPPNNIEQLVEYVDQLVTQPEPRFLRHEDLVLDCKQSQVLHQDECHALTPKQFKLLHLLMYHHDRILTRREIMEKVWDTDYLGDTRTLDVHIRWIRQKIEENPSQPNRVRTVRGQGYIFITNSQ